MAASADVFNETGVYGKWNIYRDTSDCFEHISVFQEVYRALYEDLSDYEGHGQYGDGVHVMFVKLNTSNVVRKAVMSMRDNVMVSLGQRYGVRFEYLSGNPCVRMVGSEQLSRTQRSVVRVVSDNLWRYCAIADRMENHIETNSYWMEGHRFVDVTPLAELMEREIRHLDSLHDDFQDEIEALLLNL